CTLGQAGDLPLMGHGLLDMDGPTDGRRDMILWRPAVSGTSSFFIRTTGGTGCGSYTHTRSDSRPAVSLLQFLSPDSNGDGKAEIVSIDRKTMEWRIYLSPFYVTYESFSLGNHLALPL
ncbi:MAG: hypothetical protein RMJ98_09145, partial [Myxococcales bacterium]|nr:hypothetical protein [Myxococcales bacterium]